MERQADEICIEKSNKNASKLNFVPLVECATCIPFFNSIVKVVLLTTVTLIRFAYVYS